MWRANRMLGWAVKLTSKRISEKWRKKRPLSAIIGTYFLAACRYRSGPMAVAKSWAPRASRTFDAWQIGQPGQFARQETAFGVGRYLSAIEIRPAKP